jgi:hypothetical protein
VERDDAAPRRLTLRYTFESETALGGTELALENAALTQITLNGQDAAAPSGWYADRSIGRVRLPDIQQGRNTLVLSFPYGRKIDVEAAYLLGDFGVQAAGTGCTLTAPVRSLAFGDITRQGLPFYGGNISYHLDLGDLTAGTALEITATCYRGHLLRVRAGGADQGVIAYSPYRLALKPLPQGIRELELVCYGSRINTFGQLHCVDRRHGSWWGPNSWRSAGPDWTYEYNFWPQGVLKSPEIGY